MSSRREEMLEEMGLTPVWRLRGNGTLDQPGAAERTSSAGVPSAANHVQGMDERGDLPQVNARATSGETPALQDAVAETPALSAPASLQHGRRAAIMRMEWSALKEAVAKCCECPLHAKRNKAVFGVGDENADWMFVGEGPGADEDALGDPFVGQAGKLLDNMLAAIELKRGHNVYIANVVKCRPPGNRNPEPVEAKACEPFLQRQVELIRPKLIVALGRIAAVNLLARDASVASLRGKVLDYNGTPLVVTYHPAYLLRSLTDKAKAWEDLCFAVTTMSGLQAGDASGTPAGR